MWTKEQSDGMIEIARRVKPDIKTHAIPHGLQVAGGPEAVIQHLKEQIPRVLEQ